MQKEFLALSLNGDWEMKYYAQSTYEGEELPDFQGDVIADAVPAYWEDKIDDFRMTPWGRDVRFNPTYTLQRYPMGGYVPDMCLPNPQGCFFYRRSVTVSSLDGVQEARLFIGGAQNRVSAWVNGQYIGTHEGYSASFFLAVPQGVLVEGKNTVVLAVSNMRLSGYMGRPVSGCTSRAANECTGGVYGDVELRLYTGALRDAWVRTAADLRTLAVRIPASLKTACRVEIKDGEKVICTGEIPAGEETLTLPTDGLSLWTLADPKRYTVALSVEGQTLCRKFGVRRFTADGKHLCLNGDVLYVRGICEHGYYPLTAHPPRDKGYYRRVIRTIKALGFNFIRFHTWVPMEEYMEAADELGILMEIETPNNTTYAEWVDIVTACRRHVAPVCYSSGNEMVIDEEYIAHLSQCAALVHSTTDSLFSPMSAMRGVEYFDHTMGPDRVDEPFPHNPKRIAALSEFCDLFNSYSHGHLSYFSERGEPSVIDRDNTVFNGKPLLSHEICINGTYCDLSLKERYRGTHIGDTELFTSVERLLDKKGLLDRAPQYYRASSEWQRLLRKQCFEKIRRTETMAGYDYLGDIDHHWHTFGYCVGMMNEFYELKPGETVENVLRYNSDTVLLADLPQIVNYKSGEQVTIPLLVSHFGRDLAGATLRVRLSAGGKTYLRRTLHIGEIKAGSLLPLTTLTYRMPRTEKPMTFTLAVTLSGGDTEAQNLWNLYCFPTANAPAAQTLRRAGVTVATEMDTDTMLEKLAAGETVVLFGAGPFASVPTSFQIALAGRTEGHLGAILNDDPMLEGFPHEGFCGWQCREMLNGGRAVLLDLPDIPYRPAVESVTCYKNAKRESALFSYRVGAGRLVVCTLRLREDDPGAMWLRAKILAHAASAELDPPALPLDKLIALLKTKPVRLTQNTNLAQNKNDITM